MAKQNTLQSVFYGKLGQVVGQRYRSKVMVRSYVIPHDPKTPAQLNSRAIFTRSSKLASIAMGVNYKAYFWEHPSRTEYAQRVQVANLKIRNGTDAVQTIPIIPMGFQPQNTFDDLTFTNLESWANVAITSQSVVSQALSRKICVVLAYRQSEGSEWDFLTIHTETISTSSILWANLENELQKPFELQATAITTDDNTNGNNTCFWLYKRILG